MDLKTFLFGYAYAIQTLYNHHFVTPENEYEQAVQMDSKASILELRFISGDYVTMTLNRHVSPLEGRVPFILTNLNECTFDILQSNCIGTILEFFTRRKVEIEEYRLNFQELKDLCEHFNGLDVNKMTMFNSKNR